MAPARPGTLASSLPATAPFRLCFKIGRPLASNPGGPGLARERLPPQKLARHSIEHIEKSIAIRLEKQLRGLPCQLRFEKQGWLVASQSCVSCGVNW